MTTRWSEEEMRDSVQFIAEGLAELVGFGVVVINVRDADEFVIAAVGGTTTGRRADGTIEPVEAMLGTRWPVGLLQTELAMAEDWGRFKFIHHDLIPQAVVDPYTWIPDIPESDEPETWHPYDALIAPILDEDGVVQGVVSVDSPRTGRYPDAAERRIMDRYAEQAARVVLGALHQERLRRQATQIETAALLIRQATQGSGLDEVLTTSAPQLLSAFGADGIWSLIVDESGSPVDIRSYVGPPAPTSPELITLAESRARRSWAGQEAAAIGQSALWNAGWSLETELVQAFLTEAGIGSIALTAIGAGERSLGALVLIRSSVDRAWTDDELRVLFDIGRDLGLVLANRQLLERERQAGADLRRLDRYKSELIATVSHELKNPLAVLLGNVELLEEDLADELPDVAVAATAVDRNARRMARVVDDLLMLSRVSDPDRRLDPRPVDLGRVVRDVLDLLVAPAERAEVAIEAQLPGKPVIVAGDATELDGMIGHLVRNALKFTDPGGTVTVTLMPDGHAAELTVRDTGLGISPADQAQLFTPFFRSADPAARARPGAGLGLPIVARIVARHEGEVAVTSALGRGTTFRVRLPGYPGS